MAEMKGRTEPRIWTKPLCELTPATSRGFAVIAFATDVLKVHLFPWQKWLLIHMMELDSFGMLRFRKALIIVGRQNGKTLLAAVLAAYWIYIDSARWPDQIRPQDFVVVGAAQKLDVAMKPWKQVRRWGGPDDIKVGIAPDRVPWLQQQTYPPRTTNGETALMTHTGASYLPRTFEGARGLSSTRLLLDELRQQYDFEGWAAIEKSATAMYDSLLVAFSNAGTARSVVLKGVRDTAHASIDDPEAQWFVGEWSADPDAGLDDPAAFAQANPSAGYLPAMTIKGLMRAAADAPDKNLERIEVLGQWVTATITPYLDQVAWAKAADPPRVDERGELVELGSVIAPGARRVLGVDTSGNRAMTFISVAGLRADDKLHVEVIAQRPGIVWAIEHLKKVRAKTGINEVALQSKGAPVSDLVTPLKQAGFIVHEISGTPWLNSAGRVSDAVRDDLIRHRAQPALNLAAEQGATKQLNSMPVWDREKSPVDIGPMVAVTMAAYALLAIEPPEKPKSAYEGRGLLTV